MKMKKWTVNLICILITILMVITVTTPVFAAGINVDELNGNTNTDMGKLKDFGNTLIGILRGVGTIIAVVVLVIMGIKYLMASVEEKADFKKAMIPYVVGALLVFASTWIASFVIQLVGGFSGN